MKVRRVLPVVAVLASAVMFAPSCKKENAYQDLPYLSGNLSFDLPEFAAPGDRFVLRPSGASHPEKGDFGYSWYATKITESRDTTKHIGDPAGVDGSFVLSIPDTLYTITVNCVMFADGYNNMSASRSVTVVKPESLTNVPAVEGEKSFTDERDGQVYSYITSGGLDWMNMNLRYAGAGRPYSDCASMTQIFGNLYTWEEAMTVCPDGWRLPGKGEWQELCGDFKGAAGSLMVDSYFNRDKMWEYWPAVKISNSSGMNLMPSGYAVIQDDKWLYTGRNSYSAVWTSSESADDCAACILLYVSHPDVIVGSSSREYFAASVRCVR